MALINWPPDSIGKCYLRMNNDMICITFIGDRLSISGKPKKRKIFFTLENINKVIDFFGSYLNRYKIDVDIHYNLSR